MKKPIIVISTILAISIGQSCSRADGQSRAAEELNIAEAVDRYQMEHCYSGPSGSGGWMCRVPAQGAWVSLSSKTGEGSMVGDGGAADVDLLV